MAFQEVKPNVWKPSKEGDTLIGELIRVDDSSKYKNKVYGIENKEGQWVVFGSTVLDDRMKYAKENDTVKIVYQGNQKNKKGQDTKVFTVFIDK